MAEATQIIELPANDHTALAPKDLKTQLDLYAETRKTFVDWLMEQLVAGRHYMVIHRKYPVYKTKTAAKPVYEDCSKRREKNAQAMQLCPECGAKATLTKDGAEKIADLMKLEIRVEPDFETWKMMGSTEGLVIYRTDIVSRENGKTLATGRGARSALHDGEPNKRIKMAEKSSVIDAVLRLYGISELFTQDQEEEVAVATPPAQKESPLEEGKKKAAKKMETGSKPKATTETKTEKTDASSIDTVRKEAFEHQNRAKRIAVVLTAKMDKRITDEESKTLRKEIDNAAD